MGILILVVVLVILYAVVKGVSRTTQTQAGQQHREKKVQTRHEQKSYRSVPTKVEQVRQKADVAKKHMTKKYMDEDSLRSEGRPEEVFQAAGIEADDGVILASAKLTSYAAEKDNEKIEDQDLLGPVYDLMVMGPDTSIAFERDFVAEGLELMNRYHQ